MLLDLAHLATAADCREFLCECSQGGRRAPCLPASFEEELKSLRFTNGADREFVAKKYSQTFIETMGSADSLVYRQSSWGPAEIEVVVAALQWCKNLKSLELNQTPLGDTGAAHLAEFLKTNSTLESLDLRHCGITDVGALRLAEALQTNTTLQWLQLDWNNISGEVLRRCRPS